LGSIVRHQNCRLLIDADMFPLEVFARMNQVLREEKKFLINIAEFRQKSHLLE
jgi:hypothetical protein